MPKHYSPPSRVYHTVPEPSTYWSWHVSRRRRRGLIEQRPRPLVYMQQLITFVLTDSPSDPHHDKNSDNFTSSLLSHLKVLLGITELRSSCS